MSRDARATFLDEIREQKQTIENLQHSLETAEHESRERALNIIVAIRNRFPQPVLVKYNRMNWPLDVVSHAIELLSWCGKPKIRKQLGSSFFAPSNFFAGGVQCESDEEEVSPKWLTQTIHWEDINWL